MRSSIASLSLLVALVAGCYQSHESGPGSGPAADGAVRRDGGAPIDGAAPVACDEESIPAFPGPACSDAVNACRGACSARDEPCRDACLDDPCRACVFGTIFHCANEAGCEPLWRTFACCVESVPTCTELRAFDRVRCASRCPMQFERYRMCIEGTGGMPCFMRAAIDCRLR